MSDPCTLRRGLFVALCALDRVYRVSRAPTRHEKAVAARHDLTRVVRACEDLGSVVTALAS
jgi:hypothetical protein